MNRTMIQAEVYTTNNSRFFVDATAISMEDGEQTRARYKFEAGHSSYPTLWGAVVAGITREFIKEDYMDESRVNKEWQHVDSMTVSINITRVDMDTLVALFPTNELQAKVLDS